LSAKGQPAVCQRSQATVAMVGNKLHLQVDSEINLLFHWCLHNK